MLLIKLLIPFTPAVTPFAMPLAKFHCDFANPFMFPNRLPAQFPALATALPGFVCAALSTASLASTLVVLLPFMAASWFAAPTMSRSVPSPPSRFPPVFTMPPPALLTLLTAFVNSPAPPFTTPPTPLAAISACGAMLMAAKAPATPASIAVLVQVVKPLLDVWHSALQGIAQHRHAFRRNIGQRACQRLQLWQVVPDSVHHVNGK